MDALKRKDFAMKAFTGIYPELWEMMKDRNIPNWRTEGSSTTMGDAIQFIEKVTDDEIEFYTVVL